MKRIALYVFYEKNGVVRDFHEYYLRALKNVCHEIVVIVNGRLSVSGRKKLEEIPADILVRENQGFDFSAWKEGIEGIGYSAISQYGELILCNCSCYGPVRPFESLFEEMEGRDCDFWGLYRHPALKGICPEHLQSYFLVLRKRILSSKEFKRYWDKLTVANSWQESVNQETLFTKYFEDTGFSSASYVDFSLSGLVDNPSVRYPFALLEKGFPLVKRKAFSEGYGVFLECSNGSQAKELLDYLRNSTNYPIDYIYADLLATVPGSVLRNSLHLTFSLPDDVEPYRPRKDAVARVAVIVFSYYEDLMEEDISYINNMPLTSDVFVVTPLTDLAGRWEEKKVSLMGRKVDVRVQENRGRNENAYWLTCRDVIENYDLICVAHDKKTPSARPPLLGRYYSFHCWENILKSREYVEQIIFHFEKNPRLGILMPPAPLFSGMTGCILNHEWAGNREKAREIYDRLKLNVPFDESPLAPWGAMFWLRGKAMSPFYRYDWSVEDFPMEPIKKPDGTILHAMERMYCMIAQEAGYFSAWVMPASEMGVHYDNLYYQLREAKKVEQAGFVIDENSIRFSTLKRMAKAYWKRKMKKWKL